jgi:fimbrial isopeptide formation D2 family protein/LPXTG-motif cell wall-anchored protein
LAGTGAFALALAGTFATAQLASADPGPDQVAPTKTGSLTIYKYAGGPLGEDESLDDRDTLEGVEFTATRVGIVGGTEDDPTCTVIDLAKITDWTGIEALFDQPTSNGPVTIPTGYCLSEDEADIYVDETDEDGKLVFPVLPLGVFFVSETDSGEHPIVSPVPDFFVAIPTSNGKDENGWNYDIVAHPKNQLMEEPTKTIEDQPESDLVVGDNVTWTIKIPIPTLNNNEKFTSANFHDVLDSRLEYVSSVVKIAGDEVDEDGEYRVDEDGVVWSFTPDGRLLLDDAMGGEIEITLVTKVVSVGTGEIVNRGGEDGNYWSEFNGTEVPGGPSPATYWGQLSIKKIDDSKPAALPLEGAVFKVFLPQLVEDEDEDEGADPVYECAEEAPSTTPIATGKSNAQGVVVWENVNPNTVLGLWVSNVDDVAGVDLDDQSKDYCLYETTTPAGHVANPDLVANPTITIKPGEINKLHKDVVNPKKDGPDLPLTGAQGTIAMSIGGLLLVGAGVAVALVSRRRNNAAA